MTHRKLIVALAGAAGGLLVASTAGAQPTTTAACNDTSVLPNPVFMAGSSAFEPILSQLAVQIAAKRQISIIYAPISSCLGVSAVSPPAENPIPQPITVTGHYYTVDPTDSTKTITNSCTPSGNTMATIGISDVSFDSCQGVAKPAGIGEWYGPEQSMLIIVPKANVTTTSLSAEQGAAIWGCGTQSSVGNFTTTTGTLYRSATSGTQILIARNIGVPETAFLGTPTASSSDMVTKLLAVAAPQTAIGFVAADFYASKRSVITSLAFRGIGQKKAYYADTDSTSDDLRNVRDGHYMIQGPLHLFSQLDATTKQPAANAKVVLDWLTGAVSIDTADPNSYVRIVATGGDVPQCAMKVKISKDGGYFAPYTPPVSCGCAFEKAKNLKSASACVPCTSDVTCTGGTRCQTGYCE
jgi:hypothetical protein